jgi:hypothetical protein
MGAYGEERKAWAESYQDRLRGEKAVRREERKRARMIAAEEREARLAARIARENVRGRRAKATDPVKDYQIAEQLMQQQMQQQIQQQLQQQYQQPAWQRPPAYAPGYM